MRRVVVSLGTYHLPFDRLVDWMESWQPPEVVEITLQHGVSRQGNGMQNVAMLPHPELLELYGSADALVLQGGAGGVMDARTVGSVPIMVPRLPEFDEVIDHHQVEFGQLLEGAGMVHLAQTEEQLHALLDQVLEGELDAKPGAAVLSVGADAAIAMLQSSALNAPRRSRAGRALRLLNSLVRARRAAD